MSDPAAPSMGLAILASPRLSSLASRAGPAATLVGLALAMLGLFALPVQVIPASGGDVGYVQIRATAVFLNGQHLFASAFAEIWWGYALVAVLAVLVVLSMGAVLDVAPRLIGFGITAVSVTAGLLNILALSQTKEYRIVVGVNFNPKTADSLLAHAAVGVWLGLAGLGVVAIAGLLIARRPQDR